MKVHVTQKPVLRHVESDRNGSRIAIADFEIDVAHGGVERVRVCIRNSVVGRNAARRRKGYALSDTRQLCRIRP